MKEIKRVSTLCYKTYKSSIGTESERPALWNNLVSNYKCKLKDAIQKFLNKENGLLKLIDNIVIDKLSEKRKELIKAMLKYKFNYLKNII